MCPSKFAYKYSLKKHIEAVHHKVKRFKCSICSYECYFKCQLNRHIHINHKKIKIKDQVCSMCPSKFFKKDALKKHIEGVHLKIKRFKCTICLYECYFKSDLMGHKQ